MARLSVAENELSSGLLREERNCVTVIGATLDRVPGISKMDLLEVTDDSETWSIELKTRRAGVIVLWYGVSTGSGGAGMLVNMVNPQGVEIRAIEPCGRGGRIVGTLSVGCY